VASRAGALVARWAALTIALALLLAAPVVGKSGGASSVATTPAATKPAAKKPAAKKPAATKPPGAKPAAKKPAAKKPAVKKAPRPKPLTGSFGGGATFPARTLILSAPSHKTLSASQVHVSENGRPVNGLTVTPLSQSAAGDFGVVLVIDQSPSMSGAPLSQAMTAARALAAQRTGNQELGVVTFDQTANVTLPLTSNPQAINAALAATPWVGPGTRILPALTLALEQLAAAHVAAGQVILLSDGADVEKGTKLTPQSVAAAAHAIGVPIFTVGLRDRYFSASSMQKLADIGGGTFVTATGGQLPHIFTSIVAGLAGRYLVRYRSPVSPGQQVAVSAQVAGASGTVNLSYQAPAPPPRRTVTRPPHRSAPRRPAPKTTPRVLPGLAQGSPPPAHAQSFWTSSLGILVVAAACALLLGLALAVLLMRVPASRAVQARVGSFVPGAVQSGEGGLEQASGGSVARWLERRRKWPKFVEEVEIARMRRSPVALFKRAAVLSVLAAIILAVAFGSPLVGIVPLVIWPYVLKAVVRRAARRQRAKFNDQLPSHLQDLAGAMRAGRSIVGAFSAVADSADEPTRGEFERVVTDEQLGLPLEKSIEAISVRMEAEDMQQVALIAALHRRSGSNVAEALDRVAEGARESQELRRELKALTGQARLSSLVLTSLPIVLLIGLTVIAPQYVHPLYHSTVGIVLLVISAAMVFGGFRVMKRIVNVQV
jgi:tight adherence protein B